MMLSTPKPQNVPYSQVPLTSEQQEKKLRPFHAYRNVLIKAAGIFAIISLVGLALLVVGSNLRLKQARHQIQQDKHFAVKDATFNDHYNSFKKFMFKFDKQYETIEEMEVRFNNFRKTLEHVGRLNGLEKLTSTEFGVNDFSDMSDQEFQKMLMPKETKSQRKPNFIKKMPDHVKSKMRDTAYPYPAHFDWRDKGVVTPVKAQGQCGSCWAFATAATVETSYAIGHGVLRNLSEQELLDCNLDNNACNGGDVDKAFDFVRQHGLMLEDEYPYVAHRQNSCALHESDNTTKLEMAYFINPEEHSIIEWLVTFGPVNVGISVPPDMKPYTGGVYRPSDWDCQFNVLGLHALNIVGYGTSEDGEKYWIVKNSWGQSWGIENGYVYFARGVNACGIEDEPIGLLA
ncbi:Cathepsin L-like cysteine proteinase [Aphelenchoides bicaudatus]|nr:Cathepsin L-like cysteine proteinase [Aphelenchoides bicaudatus]